MTQSLPPPKDYPLVHSSLNPQLHFSAPASPPENVDLVLGATKKITLHCYDKLTNITYLIIIFEDPYPHVKIN